MSKSGPDAELPRHIRRLQNGTADEESTEYLFKRFYPRVRGIFRGRGFSPEDAEDLAQETLVRAFKEISSLRQAEFFYGWLKSIANNVFYNDLRHHSRLMRAATEVPLEGTGEDQPPRAVRDEGPGPDEALVEKERRQRLRNALRKLPPQMRQCLTLRLEQGMKYREIAAVLKISIDTVKAHLAQGKKRLKAVLGEF